MADYSTVRERTELYAELSGLSLNKANEFRKTVTSYYTHRSDRQISRAIRGLERMYLDARTSFELWMKSAKGILSEVSDFLDGIITSVARLASRIAHAVEQALIWVEEKWGEVPDWLKEILIAIGAAGARRVLKSAARKA